MVFASQFCLIPRLCQALEKLTSYERRRGSECDLEGRTYDLDVLIELENFGIVLPVERTRVPYL